MLTLPDPFLSVCCSRLLLPWHSSLAGRGLGFWWWWCVSYLELSWAFLVQSNGNGAADAAAVKLLGENSALKDREV